MASKIFVVLALLILGSFCQISLVGFLNQTAGSTAPSTNPPNPVTNGPDNF